MTKENTHNPVRSKTTARLAERLRNASLRHKLVAAIMLTCIGALFLASTIFIAWEWISLRRAMVVDLSVHSDILADGCKAAISFDDPADANDVLGQMEAMRDVQAVVIYTTDQRRFATYQRANVAAPIPAANHLPERHAFTRHFLTVVRPILLDDERIGTICLVASLDALYTRLQKAAITITSILLIASLGAYLFSSRLQRLILGPILYLAGVAHFVSEKKEYAIRAERNTDDEVGLLIQAFNEMLEQIQQRDSALVNANELLEARVDERTAALSAANEKLTREIAIRKQGEHVLKERTERIVHHQRTLVKLSKHDSGDLPTAIREITEETAATLAVARVGVWLFDEKTGELVCQSRFQHGEENPETELRLCSTDYPDYFQAIESSRIVAANDARNDPRTRAFAQNYLSPHGITSLMDVPIHLHGKLLGILSCEHVGPPRIWSLEEQDFAASLADMVALHVEANERRKAERALARVNKHLAETVRELRRSNKELQDFAYVTAHDLKAPLRGIGTLADWISTDYADKFDAEGQEQLTLLKGRVSRMSELIDSILHYSEIGRITKCREWVDLNDLIPEVITHLAVPQHIEVTVETRLPRLVFEKVRITQIFQNLIGNAVKYMDKPQGRIRVNCTEDEHLWTFSVTDNGPGIHEKYFAKVFQMFQTLTRRDELESTGIGLSIVKKIVELNGGTVWVESQVGEGTTFAFTLPKHEKTSSEAQNEAETNDAQSSESAGTLEGSSE